MCIRDSPYSIQELLPGQGLAPVFHQQTEQPLFRLGQLDRLSVPGKGHAGKVKGEGGQLHHFASGDGPPAEQIVYPGPENREGKGLCHIVVRPQLQPGHLVALQIVGSEDENGYLTHRAYLSQQFQAVPVGQIEIQNDQGDG